MLPWHVCGLGLDVQGAEPAASAPPTVNFRTDVQPILAQRCYRCHGPDQAKGGLRLNSREAALAELDSGQRAIVPENVDDSAVVERISSTDDGLRMPPEGKPLAPEQIAILRRWIAAGAPWQNHWAFEPVSRPDVPQVENAAWVRNPIDSFVLSKLSSRNLAPAAPAAQTSLLRRVYYDLTGLPPHRKRSTRFWRTPRAMLTSTWSIGCWLRPTMASGGGGTGSTWFATLTPIASSATG